MYTDCNGHIPSTEVMHGRHGDVCIGGCNHLPQKVSSGHWVKVCAVVYIFAAPAVCQHTRDASDLGPLQRSVGLSSKRTSHVEVQTSSPGVTLLGHCLGFVVVGQLSIIGWSPCLSCGWPVAACHDMRGVHAGQQGIEVCLGCSCPAALHQATRVQGHDSYG